MLKVTASKDCLTLWTVSRAHYSSLQFIDKGLGTPLLKGIANGFDHVRQEGDATATHCDDDRFARESFWIGNITRQGDRQVACRVFDTGSV